MSFTSQLSLINTDLNSFIHIISSDLNLEIENILFDLASKLPFAILQQSRRT